MGCRSSKTKQKSEIIAVEFEKTDILKVDRFFVKAQPLFQKGESIRKRLNETVRQCYQSAGTSHLPTDKYIETIKIFLWSLSAGGNGQILRSGVKIVNGPPYISCSSNGLCEETMVLYKSLRDYFVIVTDNLLPLKNTIVDLTAMKNDLLKGRNRVDEKELVQTCNEYVRNMLKFNNGLQRMKELAKSIQTARSVVKRSIPKVKVLADEADKIGKQAYAMNLIKPVDIFAEFGPRPKKARREVDLQLSEDDIEDIEEVDQELEEQEQEQEQSARMKKSRTTNKNVSFEDDEEDSPRKGGRNRNNSLYSSKSNKGRNMNDSDSSPDYAGSRYGASDQKYTFNQGSRDTSNIYKLNKIQVDAPEMKDLASRKQIIESDDYFPRYKYYTPEKKEVEQPPPRILFDPFETTKRPLNLLDNLVVSELLKNREETLKKKETVKKEVEKKKEVIDILALTKQYLAQSQQVSMNLHQPEDIEDDEAEKNLPVEESEDLTNFCEKRRYYLINMKS